MEPADEDPEPDEHDRRNREHGVHAAERVVHDHVRHRACAVHDLAHAAEPVVDRAAHDIAAVLLSYVAHGHQEGEERRLVSLGNGRDAVRQRAEQHADADEGSDGRERQHPDWADGADADVEPSDQHELEDDAAVQQLRCRQALQPPPLHVEASRDSAADGADRTEERSPVERVEAFARLPHLLQIRELDDLERRQHLPDPAQDAVTALDLVHERGVVRGEESHAVARVQVEREPEPEEHERRRHDELPGNPDDHQHGADDDPRLEQRLGHCVRGRERLRRLPPVHEREEHSDHQYEADGCEALSRLRPVPHHLLFLDREGEEDDEDDGEDTGDHRGHPQPVELRDPAAEHGADDDGDHRPGPLGTLQPSVDRAGLEIEPRLGLLRHLDHHAVADHVAQCDEDVDEQDADEQELLGALAEQRHPAPGARAQKRAQDEPALAAVPGDGQVVDDRPEQRLDVPPQRALRPEGALLL